MTGTTQFFDPGTGFLFEGRDESYEDDSIQIFYEVHGKIFEENTHSIMRTEYSFQLLSQANKYVDDMMKVFPLSMFTITKKTRQLFRFRG